MKKLLLKLDNISIKRKFILVYVFCICLPVIAGAIIWVTFTSNEIKQNTVYYMDQTFESSIADFDLLMQTALNIGSQINADTALYNDLSKDFINPAGHYKLYWERLRNRFLMYLVSNSDIANITLYIDDSHFINCDYFRVLDDRAKEYDWYKAASASTSDIIIYPGSTVIAISPYKNRLTVIQKIARTNFLNNKTNYLLIELKLDRTFAKLYQKNNSTYTYITLPSGEMFWSAYPNSFDFKDTESILNMSGSSKYYVFERSIGIQPYFSNWKITELYNKNQTFKRQNVVLAYILLITLSIATFSVFIIWFVLNSMSYRIGNLSSHMKNIDEGHLMPLSLENPGKDEIGWLIIAFNNMIGKLNELINVVYKLEMQKKDVEVENIRAEYKYLQAQVDPHFLFNTLNAILVFCVKNGYTELTTVISSLSKLLKRLLTSRKDLIPVSEELDFIDKYLSIEKFRFGGKFDYTINIAKEVVALNFMIPKMSIQPIVENACKHGLQSSLDDNRKLVISAKIEDDTLIISVKDNGTGMGSEQVKAIVTKMESSDDDLNTDNDDMNNGVGIRNVYRRMMMVYEDRFNFKIHSAPGYGTEIILSIKRCDGR